MPTASLPEIRQLKEILQHKVLPKVEYGAPFVLFDDPPRCLSSVEIQEQRVAPLPKVVGDKVYPHVQKWRERHLNALCAPLFGCVFEGEAHYRVCPPPGSVGKRWVVRMKTGTSFLVAPGIPFSDGSKIAWEDANPESAFSRIILLQLRTDGVICRSCTCDKGQLWLHPIVFLYDFNAYQFAERIIGEMRGVHPSLPVVSLSLQLTLQYLLRTFEEGKVYGLRASKTTPMEHKEWIAPQFPNGPAVTLAEQFIKNHLDIPDLKATKVALHVGLSERHLNRLFKDATGFTISAYIDRERLKKAVLLLRHSHLPVASVGSYCGFRNPTHFSSWFARHQGQSPRQFRLDN